MIEKGEIVSADEYDITFEGKKEGTLIKENYEDFSQWTYEGSKKTFDTRKEAIDAFTAQIKPTEAQISPVEAVSPPEVQIVSPEQKEGLKQPRDIVGELSQITKEEDLRIKELGRHVEEDQSKYINKISDGKFEAINPFTGEKTVFKRKVDAAQYIFDLATKARTKTGRI